MLLSLHKNATTTPAMRQAIREAEGTVDELAARFGQSRDTIRKWRRRESTADRSHTPHRLAKTLNDGQEALVLYLRTTLRLPLDDLLAVVREFIEPAMSRSALNRMLRRHGVSRLADLEPETGTRTPPKAFKAYEPGFVPIDIKYLPQMRDEDKRRYAFVAIDRATRWVYVQLMADKSTRSAERFLKALHEAAPFTIHTILTDNAKAFTDRFTANGQRRPTGAHGFDQRCAELGIDHRLIPPGRPQKRHGRALQRPHCRDPAHAPLPQPRRSGSHAQALCLAVQPPSAAESDQSSHAHSNHEGLAGAQAGNIQKSCSQSPGT